MPCTTTQSTFINKYLPCAKHASWYTGLPVSFILGLWGLETAWGTAGGLGCGCNNPGDLVDSSLPNCSCTNPPVSQYSTLSAGVQAWIQKMNTVYGYVVDAYSSQVTYSLAEACRAVGAGCFPGSVVAPAIYAESRYDGATCPGSTTEARNNCYPNTATINGVSYGTCAPKITADACVDCTSGCGSYGCNLYATVTTDCLSPYNYVQSTDVTCS